MVTTQEIDQRLSQLDQEEQNLKNVQQTPLPKRYYGFSNSKQRQQETLDYRQQGTEALNKLREERRQLLDAKAKLQEQDRQQREYEQDTQMWIDAEQLVKSGQAGRATGELYRRTQYLQEMGMTSSEVLVEQAKERYNYEQESKKPELVFYTFEEPQKYYDELMSKGVIPEGRNVRIEQFDRVNRTTTIYDVSKEIVQEPKEYNIFEKGALFLRDKFPFLEQTAIATQESKMKAEENRAKKAVSSNYDNGFFDVFVNPNNKYVKKIDEGYYSALDWSSNKIKNIIPENTAESRTFKYIAFDYPVNAKPMAISEAVKWGAFSPYLMTTTETMNKLIETKQISLKESNYDTQLSGTVVKTKNGRYRIDLVSKTDIKGTDIQSVTLSKQTSLDITKKLNAGYGANFNIIKNGKKFKMSLYKDAGFNVKLDSKSIQTLESTGKIDIKLSKTTKGSGYITGSKIKKVGEFVESGKTSVNGDNLNVLKKVKGTATEEYALNSMTKVKGENNVYFLLGKNDIKNFKLTGKNANIKGFIKYKPKDEFEFKLLPSPKTKYTIDTELELLALKQSEKSQTASVMFKQSLRDNNLPMIEIETPSKAFNPSVALEKSVSKEAMSISNINKVALKDAMVKNAKDAQGLKPLSSFSQNPKQSQYERTIVTPKTISIETVRQKDKQRFRAKANEISIVSETQIQRSRQLQNLDLNLKLDQSYKLKQRVTTSTRIKTPTTTIKKFPLPYFKPNAVTRNTIKKPKKSKDETLTIAPDFIGNLFKTERKIRKKDLVKTATRINTGLGVQGIPRVLR